MHLGVVGDPTVDGAILPASLTREEARDFVTGFIWGRLNSRGWEWVDALPIASWDENAKISFLTNLPLRKADVGPGGATSWRKGRPILETGLCERISGA